MLAEFIPQKIKDVILIIDYDSEIQMEGYGRGHEIIESVGTP